ncbi:zinc carboxypeptidase putative metallo-peptidase Clan MC Family M14 [Leptomonas seymouri]|uniref:Zinc carboxypeptidase putative metallo-peptidase Clan MC Family M14 n=1 Tax=Leptomonas seymouri TaxID=5684 RepID=A0A0N1IKV9_LEPSE|nr:zinc carboxypeptidase putative metallo-peptidase Clan MC Family M14 [Leptomonas seymouri]|eukprot:KPI87282.1 zinc carboxypeptidase putative metallo-peptidase Clan MC Family M14 [Leptomonas seymouri]
MRQSQHKQRRTASTSSSLPASSVSTSAAPSTVVESTKPIVGRDGNLTPRQKQRAALRVATQQQAKEPYDGSSIKMGSHTIPSNGATAASGISNGAASPQKANRREVVGSHAAVAQAAISSGVARQYTSGTVARTPNSTARIIGTSPDHTQANASSGAPAQLTASVKIPAKPVHNNTASHVALRRHPSRNGVLSPRHMKRGAALVTPPPAESISVASNTAPSPRGVGAADGWAPRGSSSAVAQVIRQNPSPGILPTLAAPPLPQFSARRRESGFSNSLSSAPSQITQASVQQDVPCSIKPAPRPRPDPASLLAQQLLDEGYYLVSDGSANSSFSDTPRSARPASLVSTPPQRTAMKKQDLSARSRGVETAAGAALLSSCGFVTPRRVARREGCSAGGRARSSSSSEGRSGNSNSGDIDPNEEDDGSVHYDEEDEEQAVLTYMDSGAEASYNRKRSGSSHLTSPPPPQRSKVGLADAVNGGSGTLENGNEPGLSADSGPPSRQPVCAPSVMYRRRTSSLLNNSVACEPRSPVPTQAKPAASGGISALPHASPAPSARPASQSQLPAALSRQHSAAAAQSSLRRSPHNRPDDQSPVQPSPLNPFSLSPRGASASADEEARERQCKHLSLHEAFFFNQSRSFWLVDDHVLAKVLEYVRLMGYEHPALKRDRGKGQASLWSSSSAISSPIAPGKLKKKSVAACNSPPPANALKELNGKVIPNPLTSPSAAAAAAADAVAQSTPTAASTIDAGAKEANSNNPYAFLGKQYHLKSGKPKCAGQYANTTSTSVTHLFLTFNEALRWILEQEYVIGTVLMCCARFVGDAEADGASIIGDGTAEGGAWHPRRAMLQRGKPCIPVRLHPVHFVASLVLTHYPQWGGMTAFMRTWETQIRLVLGSAAPLHQRAFKSPDDGLILSSDQDAGNLHRVERATEPYFFLIWLEPDKGSDKRIWFRFSVTGAKEGRTLRFRLMNAAPHAKLYRQNGMMPVWRDGLSQVNWVPVDSCSFRTTNHDLDGELCFSIQARNSTETIQIAFCPPYSYADLLCHVCHWHALVKSSRCNIRFEERVLCHSPEGRKLHLLIVTSRTGGPLKSSREGGKKGEGGSSAAANATLQGGNGVGGTVSAGNATGGGGGSGTNGAASLNMTSPTSPSAASKAKSGTTEAIHGPYSNFSSGKKVVLVSGRVHPGEVTASHGVHGLISFLLSSEPRAIQLREHFIFFIVPMLNPDGVSRGHSRLDQYGNNLNRCYNDPDPETQPTVLALRCVFEHLQRTYRERFIMYLDFHSHASQSSGFMFGNSLPVRVHHWNLFFPRLVELHARHVFSFGLCRFGRVHMTSKDGASRVLFGSSLIHSYTVELTHFTDRRLYADDFTAMNNGSGVLFEVTWPPPHTPPGQATGNGEDESESCKGGLRNFNSAPSPPQASPSCIGGRCGKRTNSFAAGSGKSQPQGTPGTRQRAASVLAGAKHSTAAMGADGKGEAAAARKRGTSAVAGGHGARSRNRASSFASPPRLTDSGPSLQSVSSPSVLCQSAEVGKACLLALLDYCSIGRPSDELNVFGGMNRVLRDVKCQMKVIPPSSSQKPKKFPATATCAGMQPIYKQY